MTTGQTSGSTCAPSSFSLFSFKPWESQVKGRLSRELFTSKINLVGQNTCVSQWLFYFLGWGCFRNSLIRSWCILGAFVRNKSLLWPGGEVPYRVETNEWDSIRETVFLDSQLANISRALRHIEDEVPCIRFKWAVPSFMNLVNMSPPGQ